MRKTTTRDSKFFIIDIPLYRIDFYVSVGQSDKEFKRSVRPLKVEGMTEVHFSLEHSRGKLLTYVDGTPFCIRLEQIGDIDNVGDWLGTLSHEVTHVVIRILRRCDIPLCLETEEAYCYLTGHIIREIMDKI